VQVYKIGGFPYKHNKVLALLVYFPAVTAASLDLKLSSANTAYAAVFKQQHRRMNSSVSSDNAKSTVSSDLKVEKTSRANPSVSRILKAIDETSLQRRHYKFVEQRYCPRLVVPD